MRRIWSRLLVISVAAHVCTINEAFLFGSKQTTMDKVAHQAFKELDSDGSGVIDLKEMASKVSGKFQDGGLRLADRIIRTFEAADSDTSNDDGLVDEIEFTAVSTRAITVANEQLG